MTSYNQLTYGVRCQIYALKKTGMSQNKIARQRRVNQSTISRELLRNSGQRGYRYKQAHDMAIARRLNAPKALKMTGSTKHLIEEKIREDWSPEQISGWLTREKKLQVSHQTIYEPIWADKRCGGLLFQHLRRKGKAYTPRNKDKQAGRGCIKNRVSIDERPSTVDEKTQIGDWEIDLVIGAKHSGALLTIVERKLSFTVSKQINDKSAKTVTAATIELLTPYKDVVFTITADNGKEFAYHEQVSQALKCGYYCADPYCFLGKED
ncbi:IS30 family transposase [Marinomonas sp. IMCC 4694]|uniref:IS30 family transposase n=1 Tax=Marinomonas sp. IMCC 4694 TaxID=2605432 RepID=UPI0021CD0A92|nr:IS30 family transposase [Marinomonas sp. IMCC 4694]